ncbi:MAG: GAF domain-containing protein, partial [Spirochaetales bacterium]|nr:GAF domain-containing protein [Spirochaetales bacterium]
MNIRPKLVLLQLLAVVGFIIALSVIFIYSRSIIKLKDMQIQSEKVISMASQIKSGIDNIMTSNVDLFDQKAEIIDSVNKFGIVFNQLRSPSLMKGLPEAYVEALNALVAKRIEIYETHYIKLFQIMDSIIADPLTEQNKRRELLSVRYEFVNRGEYDNEYLQLLYELEGSLRIVGYNTYTFITELEDELTSMGAYADRSIRRSIIVSVLVLILTFGFSLFIITTFSRKIGTRIIQMRDAVKSLSLGDFSHELHIDSGDEFENFSNHFNVFKDELWEKLDSVLDFMIEISGSISIESNLDRILENVVDSGVKNTGADAGSIFLVDEIDDSIIKEEVSVGVLPPLFYVPPDYSEDIIKLKEIIKNTPILAGETIIGRSVSEGVNFFARDFSAEEGVEQNQNVDSLLFISSIIVVPLLITGRVLGTLVLAKKTPGDFFTDIDFNHIRTFSDYAALTIDNI